MARARNPSCRSLIGFALRAPRNDEGLFRRGLEGSEVAERNRGQRIRQCREILNHLREPWPSFAPPLVHVDGAVEFELDGVQSGCRIAVMLGDETAGIRLVASHRITKPA